MDSGVENLPPMEAVQKIMVVVIVEETQVPHRHERCEDPLLINPVQ